MEGHGHSMSHGACYYHIDLIMQLCTLRRMQLLWGVWLECMVLVCGASRQQAAPEPNKLAGNKPHQKPISKSSHPKCCTYSPQACKEGSSKNNYAFPPSTAQRKVMELSVEKRHELPVVLCLIAASSILKGNMKNKWRKLSKFLCNEPCVNCLTVHLNIKGLNEAHSLTALRQTFVKPLSKCSASKRNYMIQWALIKGLVSHL